MLKLVALLVLTASEAEAVKIKGNQETAATADKPTKVDFMYVDFDN